MVDFKKVLFIYLVKGLLLRPCCFFLLKPCVISGEIFLYSLVPLLQIFLELLANSFLKFHLLDIEAIKLYRMYDLDIG